MEEYWDIYDKNKKKTGRLMRRNDWCLKDDEYHLSVLGVVAHPCGKFLVTKRVMTKEWAPGWWEVPGGGVRAGEDSYAAAIREVKEETGLDVSGADGQFMFSYHRENPGEGDNYFVDIYRFVLDFTEEDVTLLDGETEDFALLDAQEIEQLGKQGIFLHYNSIRQVFEPIQAVPL